jgi:hypothetical protein
MPRRSARRTAFPRISLEVVRFAFDHLAGGKPYFIRETGRHAIKGCMLRVQRQARSRFARERRPSCAERWTELVRSLSRPPRVATQRGLSWRSRSSHRTRNATAWA